MAQSTSVSASTEGCWPSIVNWRFYKLLLGAVSMAISGFAIGANYAFSALVIPLQEEFGWSRSEINAGLASGVLVAGLVAPLGGNLLDRFGTRLVVPVSSALMGTGWMILSSATNYPTYIAAWVILFSGYPSSSVIGIPLVVGQWWKGNRGRIMGIITAGNNLYGLCSVQITHNISQSVDWRWAARTMGIIAFTTAALGALIIRTPASESEAEGGGDGGLAEVGDDVTSDSHSEGSTSTSSRRTDSVNGDNEESTRQQETNMVTPTKSAGRFASRRVVDKNISLREAMKSWPLYGIAFSVCLAWLTYGGILSQLIPHLVAEGWTRDEAATGLTVVSILGIISKVSFGRLSEIITARRAFMCVLTTQIIGLICLIFTGGSNAAWSGLVFYGLGYGGLGSIAPLTVTEQFGIASFGSIYGVVSLTTTLSGFGGTYVSGVIFDAEDQYDTWWIVAATAFATAILLLSTIRPQVDKSGDGHDSLAHAPESDLESDTSDPVRV
eukprot:GFYU01010469.1.p1 GENE.GFYU01010469.1~~GFYU01010469.1.p1  ORF type:complete len:498 (+),score=82.78 GFYU01010469.1:136-1629(+)